MKCCSTNLESFFIPYSFVLTEFLSFGLIDSPLIKLYYFLGLLKHFIQIEQNEIYEKKLYSR